MAECLVLILRVQLIISCALFFLDYTYNMAQK